MYVQLHVPPPPPPYPTKNKQTAHAKKLARMDNTDWPVGYATGLMSVKIKQA